MSRLAYHERKDKAKWAVVTIVILLIIATLVTGILSDWFTNWNKYCVFGHDYGEDGKCIRCGADKPADVQEDVGAGLVIDEDKIQASGIQMLTTRTLNAAAESVTSYTLALTVTPDVSTDLFTWTVSNNDDEAITLTVNANTRSATVVCNKAFSVAKVVTVTSETNSELTASCTLDYYKRIQNINVKPAVIALQTTLTEYTVELEPVYSAGTVTPEISISGGSIKGVSINSGSYVAVNGMEASYKGVVNFTGNKFSLIMAPNAESSFVSDVKGSIGAGFLQEAYFKRFLSWWSGIGGLNSTLPHYQLDVNWTATVSGVGQVNSGTASVQGKFDCSNLIVAASSISINKNSIVF